MAATEIDDIFGGKAKKAAKVARPSVATAGPSMQKKSQEDASAVKKSTKAGKVKFGDKGKAKAVDATKAEVTSSTPKSRAVTVVDPSKAIEATSRISTKSKSIDKKTSKIVPSLAAEDEDFMDTRGKKRARTDDGYAVYSEAELGIGSKGGDTPLCPFDCDCCY